MCEYRDVGGGKRKETRNGRVAKRSPGGGRGGRRVQKHGKLTKTEERFRGRESLSKKL